MSTWQVSEDNTVMIGSELGKWFGALLPESARLEHEDNDSIVLTQWLVNVINYQAANMMMSIESTGFQDDEMVYMAGSQYNHVIIDMPRFVRSLNFINQLDLNDGRHGRYKLLYI